MPTPTTLLLAHPKELIRAGLRAMLAGSGIKIVGEAADAKNTVTLSKKHSPAVVLLDAAIPGGDSFKLVGKLPKTLPTTKCILISADDNPNYMARARAVGATNCLLTSVSQKELGTAVENAAAGKKAAAAGSFAKVAASMDGQANRAASDSGLTPRESHGDQVADVAIATLHGPALGHVAPTAHVGGEAILGDMLASRFPPLPCHHESQGHRGTA